MRVHADDHSATCYSNGGVQTSRDNTAGIIDDPKMWIFGCKLMQNPLGSIVRHTIRDDYLQFPGRQVLREDRAQGSVNVTPLIEARHND
jgi:hypothetical protein